MKILYKCENVLCPVEECAILWLEKEIHKGCKCPRCLCIMKYKLHQVMP